MVATSFISSFIFSCNQGYYTNRMKNHILKLIIILMLIYIIFLNAQKCSTAINKINFDIEHDVLVFLHIQKTGGTKFSMNIINHLQIYDPVKSDWKKACRLKSESIKELRFKNHVYICPRVRSTENWFFTWHTFDYLVCGNHADFMRLQNCLPHLYQNKSVRSYEYISIIREPVKRYISELGNLRRKHIWDFSKNACNHEGKSTLDKCFGENRTNLSLNRFLTSCGSHVSKNRLVRWFASYNETARDCTIFEPRQSRFLLQTAKENLLKLKYFAITEYQQLSQKLFEATFKNLKFSKALEQSNNQYAEDYLTQFNESDDVLNTIKKANSLDIEFYEYALEIFFERLKMYKI